MPAIVVNISSTLIVSSYTKYSVNVTIFFKGDEPVIIPPSATNNMTLPDVMLFDDASSSSNTNSLTNSPPDDFSVSSSTALNSPEPIFSPAVQQADGSIMRYHLSTSSESSHMATYVGDLSGQ
jgi:hypothetical protein